MGSDRLILDTCALLWLASGDRRRMSEAVLAAIDRAETVCVVAITGFEIGIKHKAGKLRLPVAPQQGLIWVLGASQNSETGFNTGSRNHPSHLRGNPR